MLKKLTIYLSSFLLILSCQQFNINQIKSTIFNNNGNSNSFSIKSTTNPNEIKKSFLVKTRITKRKKDEDDKTLKFNFDVNKNDLTRSFLLNIVNGPDNLRKIGNLEVKINGNIIIFNHDEALNEITDINKIKQKLCGEKDNEKEKKLDKDAKNRNSIDCDYLLSNFFNRNTDNLSIPLYGLKEGRNELTIRVKDERDNFGLDISVEGFLKAYNIAGAIHSLVPNDSETRKMPYQKGILKIKFTEGMKVRLISNELVDLNGTSLTTLKRILS